jgi:hypothetical protein
VVTVAVVIIITIITTTTIVVVVVISGVTARNERRRHLQVVVQRQRQTHRRRRAQRCQKRVRARADDDKRVVCVVVCDRVRRDVCVEPCVCVVCHRRLDVHEPVAVRVRGDVRDGVVDVVVVVVDIAAAAITNVTNVTITTTTAVVNDVAASRRREARASLQRRVRARVVSTLCGGVDVERKVSEVHAPLRARHVVVAACHDLATRRQWRRRRAERLPMWRWLLLVVGVAGHARRGVCHHE